VYSYYLTQGYTSMKRRTTNGSNISKRFMYDMLQNLKQKSAAQMDRQKNYFA
jgi:hypothetical protein